MRGAQDVLCERNSGGRDHMYRMKEGAVPRSYMGMGAGASPYYPNAAAAAAFYQRMWAKPAGEMKEDEYLGNWVDSLGNSVTVYKNAPDKPLSAVLRKPPRNDIVLTMVEQDLGSGWKTWRCGNSTLNIQASTEEQLCWSTNDGRLSVWMRDTSGANQQFNPASAGGDDQKAAASAEQTDKKPAESKPEQGDAKDEKSAESKPEQADAKAAPASDA